jgi:hypothetical protein
MHGGQLRRSCVYMHVCVSLCCLRNSVCVCVCVCVLCVCVLCVYVCVCVCVVYVWRVSVCAPRGTRPPVQVGALSWVEKP